MLLLGRDGDEEVGFMELLQHSRHFPTYVLTTITQRVRRIFKS